MRRNTEIKPPLILTVEFLIELTEDLPDLQRALRVPAKAAVYLPMFQEVVNEMWEKKYGMKISDYRARTANADPTTEKGAWKLFAESVDEIYPDYPDLVPALKKLALEQAARA